jgi:hypothetical protein
VHADWKWRGWQARALYADGRVSDVAELDAALGLAGDDSIGETNHGWYVESGYDISRLWTEEEGCSLVPFGRYERYGTQESVPDGFQRDPALDVSLWTAGLAWKPIPNIVIKADYQNYSNDASTGVDRVNVALGYLF